MSVDLELVTFQMLADESQQRVQDPHRPRHRGGRRVSVACGRKRRSETLSALGGGTVFPPDQVTFEQVAHQRKVEVGAEVQAHEVIHLRTVPLQRTPDLHEHFFWTL